MNRQAISITALSLPLILIALVAPACETEGYDDILEVLAEDQAEAQLEDSLEDSPESALGLDSAASTAEARSSDTVFYDMPRRGRLAFSQDNPETFTDTECRSIEFTSPFPAGDADQIRIAASIDHVNHTLSGRDATTVWVEDVDRFGAEICVRETASFDGIHNAGLTVAYRAYREDRVAAAVRAGRVDGPTIPGGNQNDPFPSATCANYDFATPFASGSNPRIMLTITHPDGNPDTNRNATTIWAERVSATQFRACVRETGHASNHQGHVPYSIDYYAFLDGSEGITGESGRRPMPEVSEVKYCWDTNFSESYTEAPLVFVNVAHPWYQSADHHAVTAWAEDVSTASFRACARQLAAPNNSSATVPDLDDVKLRLDWLAIEDAESGE